MLFVDWLTISPKWYFKAFLSQKHLDGRRKKLRIHEVDFAASKGDHPGLPRRLSCQWLLGVVGRQNSPVVSSTTAPSPGTAPVPPRTGLLLPDLSPSPQKPSGHQASQASIIQGSSWQFLQTSLLRRSFKAVRRPGSCSSLLLTWLPLQIRDLSLCSSRSLYPYAHPNTDSLCAEYDHRAPAYSKQVLPTQNASLKLTL